MLEAESSPCFPTNFKYSRTPSILNPDDKPCVTPNKSHLSILSFIPSSHCGGAPMPTVLEAHGEKTAVHIYRGVSFVGLMT